MPRADLTGIDFTGGRIRRADLLGTCFAKAVRSSITRVRVVDRTTQRLASGEDSRRKC